MANDKREQARNKAKQDALNAATVSDCDRADCAVNILLAAEFGFDAGHAAATAEADGWVAIETVDDLPEHNGRYVTQDKNGQLQVQDYDSHRIVIWLTTVVAYQREPIQPYQRQSSGGGSNER